MTDKKLEERIRACREIDEQVTLDTVRDLLTNGAEREANFGIEETIEQMEALREEFKQARINDIRSFLTEVITGVDQKILDAVTYHTVVVVHKDHLYGLPNKPEWLRGHCLGLNDTYVVCNGLPKFIHPGTPSVN